MIQPTRPHIEARGVVRAFQIGRRRLEILHGIDLAVGEGETVFLCGASGAGKTTLLYTLAGLERPQAGTIVFEGADLSSMSDDRLARTRNSRMGFVFQSYFLLPELTALENVALPSMIGGQPNTDRARDLLARVGLGDRCGHLPSELSGGEQQRVAIARALVNDPGILFADEPTGNLDSQTGEAVLELLLDVSKQDGRTMVIVTHDHHLARRGDRLLHIEDGKIRDAGKD